MKKLLLLSTAVIMSGMSAMAQSTMTVTNLPVKNPGRVVADMPRGGHPMGAVTADGDTTGFFNASPSGDTATFYTFSSGATGFISGTGSLGNDAYAERYDFPGVDSTLQIIAVGGIFFGHIVSSTMAINFNVWSAAGPVAVPSTPNWHYASLPSAALSTQAVAVADITPSLNTGGTYTKILSTQPSVGGKTANKSVFVGYSMTYTAADSFLVLQAKNGHRHSAIFASMTATDTVLNTQNAARNGGTWDDYVFQTSSGMFTHLFVAPIYVVHYTGVAEIAHKGLSLYGSYPNPATNNVNFKYSLDNMADVTISITDMTGRTIQTVQLPKQASGEHVYNTNLSGMTPGNYVYRINTSEGGSIGAQMTVK